MTRCQQAGHCKMIDRVCVYVWLLLLWVLLLWRRRHQRIFKMQKCVRSKIKRAVGPQLCASRKTWAC